MSTRRRWLVLGALWILFLIAGHFGPSSDLFNDLLCAGWGMTVVVALQVMERSRNR